ncbi:MAG: tail fiber domain-containing protein, partial [candidate division WOR-3 bacterium]
KELLKKVAGLRVRNYKMKDQHDGTRHIGPVAQDFYAAFGVGENEKSINMADADGVLLAVVQALYEEVQQLRETNRAQQAEIEALKAHLK